MTTEKYSIGGSMVEPETHQDIVDIPGNRPFLAIKLTGNPSIKPEIVEGLINIEQVFERYRPKAEVSFETENGSVRRETLSFAGLGDFGIAGITAQSVFLQNLKSKKLEYTEIIRQLNSNKLLRQALMQLESKTAVLNVIEALIMEIETTKAD